MAQVLLPLPGHHHCVSNLVLKSVLTGILGRLSWVSRSLRLFLCTVRPSALAPPGALCPLVAVYLASRLRLKAL